MTVMCYTYKCFYSTKCVHYKFHELIYLFVRINYDCLNQRLCSPKSLKVEKMTSSGLYIRASSARSSSASLPGFRRLLSLLGLNMLRRWTHNHLLFTRLRLLKDLKKMLHPPWFSKYIQEYTPFYSTVLQVYSTF